MLSPSPDCPEGLFLPIWAIVVIVVGIVLLLGVLLLITIKIILVAIVRQLYIILILHLSYTEGK